MQNVLVRLVQLPQNVKTIVLFEYFSKKMNQHHPFLNQHLSYWTNIILESDAAYMQASRLGKLKILRTDCASLPLVKI